MRRNTLSTLLISVGIVLALGGGLAYSAGKSEKERLDKNYDAQFRTMPGLAVDRHAFEQTELGKKLKESREDTFFYRRARRDRMTGGVCLVVGIAMGVTGLAIRERHAAPSASRNDGGEHEQASG